MIEIETMFPVMVTANLETVKPFYETTFDFKTVFYEKDFYLHLVSASTGAQLGFLAPEHISQPEFLQAIMPTNGYVISFEVKDVAIAYEQAKSSKLNIAMEIKEEAWGQVHFILKDPAGFHVDVVQHLQAPAS